MQFTGILRDLARDAAQQRLYLPRELLLAEGIFATMPSYVLAQPALTQVCNALAERAEAYFVDAERTIPVGPSWAMLATTAVLGSYRALLKALLARGWARIDTSRSTFRLGAKQHCCSVTVSLPADQPMTGIADVTGSLPH
jgi:phytoene/squalene synthetase